MLKIYEDNGWKANPHLIFIDFVVNEVRRKKLGQIRLLKASDYQLAISSRCSSRPRPGELGDAFD